MAQKNKAKMCVWRVRVRACVCMYACVAAHHYHESKVAHSVCCKVRITRVAMIR